jgi:glycogen phosphorylase
VPGDGVSGYGRCMRPLRRFRVEPWIPDELAPLRRLATNLHWTWDTDLKALFPRLDAEAWEASGHDPVHTLERISVERWTRLADDAQVVADVADAAGRLDAALMGDRWFQHRTDSPLGLVAYFSPEFGLSETLPQYSGGLGILAGDHLKAASDLGVPLVGIGILYAEGYFRQRLDADGWQDERFPRLDPAGLAITPTDITVNVDIAGEDVRIAVWRVDVGRVTLYLLDTAVAGNSPSAASITDRLYGGDTEHRLRQEIVLGIGGVRALRALGLHPDVFHSNEGHAGFNSLERIREFTAAGWSFDDAIEMVRAGGVFTTHTPVPAGIDRFPEDMMRTYFGDFATSCGIDIDRLLTLGRRDDEDDPEGPRFNMAVMGLRLAARCNGVASLHGEVSRSMFQGLWPDVTTDEVPIGSITNGVHAHTWISAEIDHLFSRAVDGIWDGADDTTWRRASDIPAEEIWRARATGRARLVDHVRGALGEGILDPEVLTIGFARRFATYKRATLLLSQPERLRALLLSTEQPVQFVFAGKAHPADHPGKEMIQRIEQFARDLEIRHRFVFVQDYDMAIARTMYHGCDVWLNNPLRPHEACGTSGMKAALNGGLNCSVLDGWWDEWFDGHNGWAIPSADDDPDDARRDNREATALFGILEHDVVPMFYERSDDGLPHRWIDRIRHNWVSLGPKVTAARMVRDYVVDLYEPAAMNTSALSADDHEAAHQLTAWKRRIRDAWPGVRVVSADSPVDQVVTAGVDEPVRAVVHLAGLSPDDVRVEVVHGPLDREGDFRSATDLIALTHVGEQDGCAVYEGTYHVDVAGPHGFGIRVVPHHRLLAHPMELGLVRWG